MLTSQGALEMALRSPFSISLPVYALSSGHALVRPYMAVRDAG